MKNDFSLFSKEGMTFVAYGAGVLLLFYMINKSLLHSEPKNVAIGVRA
jgi:hypothetical protein